MKLYVVLSIFFAVQASALTHSQNQKLVININGGSLEQMIQQIKKQSDYRFLYNLEEIAVANDLDLHLESTSIAEVMQEALVGKDLDFKVVNDVIIVSPSPGKAARDRQHQLQQQRVTVTGRVTDSKGIPIPGANIFEKTNPTNGVISNVDGHYSIEVSSAQAVLTFSFIGFDIQEQPVNGQTMLNVTLYEEATDLNEVVVIGFGRKDKKSLTSSIVSMDKEEMERLATTSTSVDNMLGGTMKGVMMTQNSGEPGATPRINIRGITTPYPNMTSGQANNIPLFVIDGIPMFVQSNAMNPLLALAPNDIESIDVLKDAAATAIYGSRGANGVIIINTKNGHKGDNVNIDAGYTFSIGNPVKEYEPLNNEEFKELQDMILSSTVTAMNEWRSFADEYTLGKLGNVELDWETWQYAYNGLKEEAFGTENTNWVDEVKNKNAATHQYNFAMRGGTERTNYSFSFNGINQEGLFINDQMNRYGARLSVDTELSDRVKMGAMMNYSVSERNSADEVDYMASLYKPWLIRPDVPVYNETGDFQRIDGSILYYGMPNDMANPVALREKESVFNNNQFMGNAYLDIELTEDLGFHTDVNVANYLFNNEYFSPLVSKDIMFGIPTYSSLDVNNSNTTSTALNFRLDYKKDFDEHKLTAMLGYSADRTFSKSGYISYEGFPSDRYMHNPGSARQITMFGDDELNTGLNSIYGRFTYSYDHRYLVEAAIRADESSKFGPDNRWGYFPAVSLGWRINNESFLKDVAEIDDLKLRLSAGQTGSTNVADFSYRQYFLRNSSDYYGGELSIDIKDLLPNEGIKWEMTTEYNGGFDFSFFKHRLYGSFDAYYRYTEGALAPAPHILESGMKNYYANIIDVSNKGMELSLGGDIIRSNSFVWNSNFNIAFNRNNIEKLNSASINPYMQDSFLEGHPAGTKRGYKVKEIIQDQAVIDELNMTAMENGYNYYQESSTAVGDYLMEDVNGDGRITKVDEVVITNPEPDFFGGWSNTLTHKNLSLSFIMQFSQGVEALWSNLMTDAGGNLGLGINREMFGKTWTPENTDAEYAQLINSSMGYYNYTYSDKYVFDASYIRMKNITLSYQLPAGLLKNMRIKNASVFASATNLFTITEWPGLDPELLGGGVTSMSVNDDPYPLSKTFSIGIKVQL
ncbi:SusC/RagA family TonB-linked outer membrane protein [Carboxylicivirga taeanensis]|uniref:SusC/RagA family TonB-linked outer membrane protein n=1 Tax=Carboxylicivirga taeanensis TaxID=1416875 RepID=UPI003F6E2092